MFLQMTQVFLTAALFAVAPVLAHANGGPVVLYGSTGAGPAPDATAALARASALVGGGQFNTVLPLADGLELNRQPLWVFGAELTQCSGEPVIAETIPLALKKSIGYIDSLDMAEAKQQLDRAAAALPCSTRPVPRADIYGYWMALGLWHFVNDEGFEAKQAFAKAAAVDPSVPWDEVYTPEAKRFFDAAKGETFAAIGADVSFLPELAGDVFVNGQQVDRSAATRLFPGQHLVQVCGQEGCVGGMLTVTAQEKKPVTIRLGNPASVEHLILAKDGQAAALVVAEGRARGWGEVILVSEMTELRLDITEGRFVSTTGIKVTSQAEISRRRGAAVMTVISSGTAAVGFAMHGIAYVRVRDMLEQGPPIDPEAYEIERQRNTVGFVVGVTGTSVATIGLVASILQSDKVQEAVKNKKRRAMLLPYGAVGPGGATAGLSGRW